MNSFILMFIRLWSTRFVLDSRKSSTSRPLWLRCHAHFWPWWENLGWTVLLNSTKSICNWGMQLRNLISARFAWQGELSACCQARQTCEQCVSPRESSMKFSISDTRLTPPQSISWWGCDNTKERRQTTILKVNESKCVVPHLLGLCGLFLAEGSSQFSKNNHQHAWYSETSN